MLEPSESPATNDVTEEEPLSLEPLGIKYPLLPPKPLGQALLQPKFLYPLGARPFAGFDAAANFPEAMPDYSLLEHFIQDEPLSAQSSVLSESSESSIAPTLPTVVQPFREESTGVGEQGRWGDEEWERQPPPISEALTALSSERLPSKRITPTDPPKTPKLAESTVVQPKPEKGFEPEQSVFQVVNPSTETTNLADEGREIAVETQQGISPHSTPTPDLQTINTATTARDLQKTELSEKQAQIQPVTTQSKPVSEPVINPHSVVEPDLALEASTSVEPTVIQPRSETPTSHLDTEALPATTNAVNATGRSARTERVVQMSESTTDPDEVTSRNAAASEATTPQESIVVQSRFETETQNPTSLVSSQQGEPSSVTEKIIQRRDVKEIAIAASDSSLPKVQQQHEKSLSSDSGEASVSSRSEPVSFEGIVPSEATLIPSQLEVQAHVDTEVQNPPDKASATEVQSSLSTEQPTSEIPKSPIQQSIPNSTPIAQAKLEALDTAELPTETNLALADTTLQRQPQVAFAEVSQSAPSETNVQTKPEKESQDDSHRRVAGDITGVFEGGKPDSLQIKDVGIISYGKHQATLASGSLYSILKTYTEFSKTSTAGDMVHYLERVHDKDASLREDKTFIQLLKDAASDPEMARAQDEVFAKKYWEPAKQTANKAGIKSALGEAIFYDTKIQGGLASVLKKIKQRLKGKECTEQELLSVFLEERRNYLIEVAQRDRTKAEQERSKGNEKRAEKLDKTAEMLDKSAKSRIGALEELVNSGDLDLIGDEKGQIKVKGKKIDGLGKKVKPAKPIGKQPQLESVPELRMESVVPLQSSTEGGDNSSQLVESSLGTEVFTQLKTVAPDSEAQLSVQRKQAFAEAPELADAAVPLATSSESTAKLEQSIEDNAVSESTLQTRVPLTDITETNVQVPESTPEQANISKPALAASEPIVQLVPQSRDILSEVASPIETAELVAQQIPAIESVQEQLGSEPLPETIASENLSIVQPKPENSDSATEQLSALPEFSPDFQVHQSTEDFPATTELAKTPVPLKNQTFPSHPELRAKPTDSVDTTPSDAVVIQPKLENLAFAQTQESLPLVDSTTDVSTSVPESNQRALTPESEPVKAKPSTVTSESLPEETISSNTPVVQLLQETQLSPPSRETLPNVAESTQMPTLSAAVEELATEHLDTTAAIASIASTDNAYISPTTETPPPETIHPLTPTQDNYPETASGTNSDVTVAQLFSETKDVPVLPTVLENLAQLKPLGHSSALGQSAVEVTPTSSLLTHPSSSKELPPMIQRKVETSVGNSLETMLELPRTSDEPKSISTSLTRLDKASDPSSSLSLGSDPNTDIPTSWSSIAELLGQSTTVQKKSSVIQRRPDERHVQEELVFTPEGFQRADSISDRASQTTRSGQPTIQMKKSDRASTQSTNIPIQMDSETESQPITITAPNSSSEADSRSLEILAQEIYNFIRQRLEIERERHGYYYSGRLPW